MAGNLPVPQGLELKITWAQSGIPVALNILHFRHGVGQIHSQARADTLATLTRTAFTTAALNAQMATVMSLSRVESRHMDSNSDPWFVGAGAPVAGTGVGDMLPLANSICISLSTGLRGRSFNGRTYLCGFVEGANATGGTIAQAAADAARSFLNALKAEAQSQLTLTQCILSRWTTPPGSSPNTPPTERNPPILTDVIAASERDLRWDVQRRRNVPGV